MLRGPEEITRCGLVTHVEILPSDGGFAKYQLTIESPLALLAHRITNRTFQDLSVPDIVEQVLKEHIANNPAIASVLSMNRVLRRQYMKRSYCNQYRESDLAFIERILFEEGIAFYWEHEAGETPKCHFVIFDDPYDLPQAAQDTVRFHRAEATESEDSLTEWTEHYLIGPAHTRLISFDYKTAYTYETHADTLSVRQGKDKKSIPVESSLEDYDAPTLYYGKNGEDLRRYTTLRQDVHDRKKSVYRAEGNLRQLIVGEWFALKNHPSYDKLPTKESEFVACELEFRAYNNLPKGLPTQLPQSVLPDNKDGKDSTPPYWVRLSLRKRGQPLTPAYAHTRHARPTARGVQTGIVTGPAKEEVYTDDMGRIRVQFHWQRPSEHPDFGANFDERSSCWIRVAYPSAGAGWGSQYIPRIGQEVLVDFIEGDIDRPIVIGVIHSGARTNPWFSGVGTLPANRTLSGIKTKEFFGHKYNEILFDDTLNEVRTKVSSEHGKTQLNQGYLIHPRKDGKGEPRGEGAELRTDHHAAIRAAEGLLLSTETCPGASGKQLDREAAEKQLDAAQKAAQVLSDTAERQNADITEIGPRQLDEEGQKQDESPKGHLDHMVEALKAWETGTNTDREGKSASGKQPGKQGVLLASGAEGLSLTTPQEMVLASGSNLDTISQRDTQQTTVRRWLHNVGKKISLFVLGIKDKVNLKLTVANGHAQLHAQSGDVEIAGDQNLRLYAVKEQLLAAAGKEVLITSQGGGAYIRLKGPDIEIHCPGNLSFKSANQSATGPTNIGMSFPSFNKSDFCLECLLNALKAGSTVVRV